MPIEARTARRSKNTGMEIDKVMWTTNYANLDDYRRRSLSALRATACIALLWAAPSWAADTPKGGEDVAAAGSSKGSASEYLLDRGDKLRIRFFDRYDRDDLNGDYLIGESGKLRLPRLGLFEVRNKTTAEVEQAVRESAERRGEKLGSFYVDIVECRPIYVSGLANRPGAYPFVSGLTVMHAVALAGGIYRSVLLSPGESLRERNKVGETLEKLKEPLAKKARLEAELEGSAKVALSADLVELDPANASSTIAREQLLLLRAREKDARERESLSNMIHFSQSEVDSFDAEIVTMNQRIGEQSQLFERLKTLYSQKIVNSSQYNQSLIALDSVQRDKQLAIAGVARAKAAVEKAKKDLAMVTLGAKSSAARELAETDAEISRLKSQADGQRRLAASLDSISGRTADDEQMGYRIMRQNTAGAIVSMPAGETTLLMPGDIVQIDGPRQGSRVTSQ